MTSTNPRQLRWDAQTLEAFQRRVQEINQREPWRHQTVAGLVREVLAKAAEAWEEPVNIGELTDNMISSVDTDWQERL